MSHPSIALICGRVRVEERQLFEAFGRRGVHCEHIDDRGIVYQVGESFPRWDAVLNRSISATTRQEVSRVCAAERILAVNRLEVVQRCDNKFATALQLNEADVPTPATAIALDPQNGGEAVEAVGYPAVVKPVTGSWGRGLAKVSDPDAAEAVFGVRAQLATPQQRLGLAQGFVVGRDIRVLVVGNQAVAAMARESGHWIRNTARGARADSVPLDGELTKLAVRAAEAVGGGVLGVDLLEGSDGDRTVLEVNAAPEFHGLAEAHPDLDIAGAVADFVVEAAAA